MVIMKTDHAMKTVVKRFAVAIATWLSGNELTTSKWAQRTCYVSVTK